ncbi:hypothetical protein ACJX0J_033283, partial [Zea mays]
LHKKDTYIFFIHQFLHIPYMGYPWHNITYFFSCQIVLWIIKLINIQLYGVSLFLLIYYLCYTQPLDDGPADPPLIELGFGGDTP